MRDMSQRVESILIDDLDGAELDDGEGSTVSFALDGKTYELDLSAANRQRLQDMLRPFIAKARRRGGRPAEAPGKRTARVDSAQLNAMRQWATANGHTISKRGKVPTRIQLAYHGALGKTSR